MGASESTEKLGQRVVIAKGKLERDLQSATERYEYLKQNSARTLATMIESVADSFSTCSPFLESTLLIAWLTDADKCKEIVLTACRKVLRAPIQEDEYNWFKQYVFSSNIWMQKSDQNGTFMYEEMLAIGHAMSSDIVTNMDSIYVHLQSHKQWHKVMAIENKSFVPRQDEKSVGLLRESGLSQVFEMKSDGDDQHAQCEDMKNFVHSNLAINMLTSTASKVDGDFQRHIQMVMSSYGTFKPAPMKKVERSLSKCENDYKNERFPKAAKLLDLVRCSVTFNTVEQLIVGYDALLQHMKAHSSILELARVKNGFINTEERHSGYRDIKLNVVYKSQNPEHKGVRMICEVQLLLINYLEEKKKIHKLYSIAREETFFKMVVSVNADGKAKDAKDLQFEEALNVGQQVSNLSYKHNNEHELYKCSVDSDLGLLAIEGHDWFGVVDMATKKEVWKLNRKTYYYAGGYGTWGFQTHQWLLIGDEKYVSVQTNANQIKMFKAVKDTTRNMFTATQQVKFRFLEDRKYELNYSNQFDSNGSDGQAIITFCDFDHDFKHIFLIVDSRELQKRAVSDIGTVLCSVELKEIINDSQFRNFRLSADGRYCVLGGGINKTHFYVIDIENEKQQKLISSVLHDAYVPCFINGDHQLLAVCDRRGQIEIWDLTQNISVKVLRTQTNSFIRASASVHNIFAIASLDKTLRLYSVKTWECFYTKSFECAGSSLHLTEDLKYVTVAGNDAKKMDRCVVLEIK